MTTSIFIPAYISVIQKAGDRWSKPKTAQIFNVSGKPYEPKKRYGKHGLTEMGILKELYKRYQGLDGWYLVHMAQKQYYYCGATLSDVRHKLVELGINHG